MSIMVWQVMRKLPKPLLLIFLFFLLAAVAVARPADADPGDKSDHGSHHRREDRRAAVVRNEQRSDERSNEHDAHADHQYKHD